MEKNGKYSLKQEISIGNEIQDSEQLCTVSHMEESSFNI